MDKKVLHSVFEEVVRKHPLKPAVETGNTTISYNDLNIYVNRIAHLLKSIGCENGTIVHVVIPASVQLVCSLLSVFKSGGIFLPVDLSFSEKRLKQIFEQTFDGLVIATPETYDAVIALANQFHIKIDHLIVLDKEYELRLYNQAVVGAGLALVTYDEQTDWKENLPLQVTGDSSNYIFYTSGSTGNGKAIEGAHVSLSHFIHWEIKEFGIDESFRVSQLAQVTFDASLRDIFVALIAGGTLCIPAADIKNNPGELVRWLEESKINLVHCVPSLFRVLTGELQLQNKNDHDFSHLKFILLAGELLYARDILNWQKIAGESVQLVNLYGPTETTLVKTFYKIDKVSANPSHIIPVGVPISNTVVAIINDGSICKVGETGEVYIKTPFATKGYYRNEALTKEFFVQNPLQKDIKDIVYKTGDIGRYLADGNIEILGRIDSQVKVNGVRVELGEIEQALLENEKITGAIVKAHRTEDNLVTIVAYYTGEKMTADHLREALGKVVNQQMIPSWFVHLEKFPVNINGKIDKKALPLPEDVIMGAGNFSAPVGLIENKLAVLWKELLGLKKIGRNISFFSVGGHSLLAIQLISRIHKELGVNLKIADVFRQRTIQEMAALISDSMGTEYKSIKPADKQDSYPVSFAQRRFWILSQFEEANIAYNMTGVYEFGGTLDLQVLDNAFKALIERHESLRTIFKEEVSGEIRQYIRSFNDTGFYIGYCDLRIEKEQPAILKNLVKQQCIKPFDLSSGPLLRACLYQLTDDKWVFCYVMHHIISDGWSMRILLNELLYHYNTCIKGACATLLPLRLQYKDYAVWQQQEGNNLFEADKAWWLKQFEGSLPLLDLPYDKPRPVIKTFSGGVVRKTLNEQLTTQLKQLSRQQEGTFFMGLLAVINTLLYRYTGKEDIIVGSPVAGRMHAELEDQIGCYLNTLALRTRFSGENSFLELFNIIKQVTVDAYQHESYPFDDLVNALNLQYDTARNPLFDVVVVLHNTEMAVVKKEQAPAGLAINRYEDMPYETSKFDLTFNFLEWDNTLQLTLEYNSDLFDQSTALRIANHFEQLVAAVVEDTATAINRLNYLSEMERQQLLIEFNNTSVPYPKEQTIVALFEEQVQKTPDRIALEFQKTTLSYRQLNEIANRFGDYLRRQYGIQQDDLVGIKLERSEWMIIAILGVLKSGSAYVPVDPEYPQERIWYLLEDSQCKLLIDENTIAGFKADTGNYSNINFSTERKATSLAYVMYTSGSTGTPKGVMIEDRSVIRLVKPGNFAALTGEEVVLSTGSFSFDATTFEYWATLLNGGRLVICSTEVLLDTGQLAAEIEKRGVDTMWFTAGWLNQLVDTDISLFKNLKTVLAGGDRLSTAHIKALQLTYPALKIINGYGPTENTTFSLTCLINPSLNEIPVGRPVNNSTAYIIDSTGSLLPVGVPGEICVGGDGLARGYWNNPQLTSEKFINNSFIPGERIYKTGDIGKWLPDGNIAFLGRKDDQVKIRGFRVELKEIEAALTDHAAIDDAVVIVKRSGEGEKKLIAYIVSKEVLNIPDIRSHLARILPAYMIPGSFVQLESLPLTSNGKVDKKSLPDPETKEMETGTTYVPPRNEAELNLIAVYEQVLRKDGIGIRDDFFVLGGDSIKCIQVISRLKQKDYSLTIRDILLSPVVEDLAMLMKTASRQIGQELVEGDIPLSPIQAYFFERDIEDKHHYNQSVLLFSKEPISEDGIRKALDKIVFHHDVLRTVFSKSNEGWVQKNRGADQTYSFEVIHDVDGVSINEHCEQMQASIDLEKGPLFKAALVKGQDGDRLLLVAHHLVIDGVSWRILFEDLSTLYQQYLSNQPLLLPLKTDSFLYWQQKQIEYAGSETLMKEDEYWSAIESLSIKTLPVDEPVGRNLIKDTASCSLILDEETTSRLLTECYKAYRTEINDILLGALSLAIHETFQLDKILIKLEGHGREDIGSDTDVTRTIGWFTIAYPVVFDMRYNSDIIRQLIEIKEVLHRVPNKGIGYGILRYLAKKDYKLQPEITFNYLGDFGSGVATDHGKQLFEFSGDYRGKDISDNIQRDAMLEVSGLVADGKLRMSVVYSEKQFEVSTIDRLWTSYRGYIEDLISQLSTEEQIRITPVDLTYKGLTVEQLEKLNQI